jgi:NAD(P)-dependent dehydrogenase (short-subunit alcohol dehydrogenase family)
VDAFVENGAKVGVLEWDKIKTHQLDESSSLCAVNGDARDEQDCARAVEMMVAQYGGIDTLICCAGVFDFYRTLESYTSEELIAGFGELMSINVLGQMLPAHTAYHELKESKGSIILTGSSSSFFPGRGGVLYLASKYAIRGCVSALACEMAPDVRVNGVAPGGTIGTGITGPASVGMDLLSVPDDAGRVADLKTLTPLELALRPEDHAASYLFLSSPGASSMTGIFLHPDGGMAVRG